MNPTLLRRILTWAAPFVIGYIVKKYEDRQAKKQKIKELSEEIQELKNQ